MSLGRVKSCTRTCLALAGVAAALLPADAGVSPLAPLARANASSALTSVNEYGRLEKQGSSGANIDEKGIGWGSFNCSVVMELTLSGTLVTARYTAYLSGGSISGTATAHIRSATKTTGYFSGTITLRGGTRSRTHASGTAKFSGEINRTHFNMKTHITGNLRLR